MLQKQILKCALRTKGVQLCGIRLYSNRNILKLHERGMFQDIFPTTSAQEVVDLCNAGPQCVYAGFDPTASTLHVGNLLVLQNLLHWQRSGHQPIALVGGATGRIGDPSGRTKERDKQDLETVRSNVTSIQQCIQRVFDNHQKYFWKEEKDQLLPIKVLNNASWYRGVELVDWVCQVGSQLRMGTLLGRSSVESRLASETGMSFQEFTYQLFQAYDWLHLFKNHNCRFQVGGNDQMGNIMTGHDLISRITDQKVYGLTMPLITSESGYKYGKSAGNAVWLDGDMTSPFELYQFMIRATDNDVAKLLKLFTFLPTSQIDDVVQKHLKSPEARQAQKLLAENVTLLIHGEEGLASAKRASKAMYSSSLENLSGLSAKEITVIFKGATQVEMLLQPGISLIDMALSAKCFLDIRDAERIIRAGGFYINHSRANNPNEILVPGVHILPNNVSLVRVGKRNYWIIKWLN